MQSAEIPNSEYSSIENKAPVAANVHSKAQGRDYETKYLKEKKRRELIEKNAEIRRKNMWIGMTLMLIFFSMVTGYLFYIQYKLKIRQQQQETELEAAIAELRGQNKSLEQRLQVSGKNNDSKS